VKLPDGSEVPRLPGYRIAYGAITEVILMGAQLVLLHSMWLMVLGEPSFF
jgi:hypothetical protein